MHETQSRPADSWKFTPANTAVVIVDMQNIWVHPRGARYLPSSEDIVPNIQELLRYCHDRKFPWFTCIRPNAKIWPTSASLARKSRAAEVDAGRYRGPKLF